MILLPTHIVADEPSPISGRVYPRQLLEGLVEGMASTPGTFGRLKHDGDRRIITPYDDDRSSYRIELTGCDLIDDRLFVKIEADDNVADIIYEKDYSVWLLCSPMKIENNRVQSVGRVVGVILEEKDASKVA